FFQAEDGIRDFHVTGVQTCALPISPSGKEFPLERCVLSHVTPITRYGRPVAHDALTSVEVRRSRRRTATVSAYRDGGRTIVAIRSEERRVGKERRSR